MPTSTDDALKVEAHINRIFSADGAVARAEAIRRLFVEVLDFHGAAGQVSLEAAKGADLPDFAELIASLDGVRVVWVDLETKRVNKREAAAAARLIEQGLGQDLLLACTNRDENLGDASQFHLILPDFTSGTVPKLRRRTVERGLPQRTAYEQIAGIYSEDDPLPVRQALKKAFDVEPVTRDFFRKYDELFKAAKGLVTGLEDEDRHLFVQTLFNRLLFVHFLSRKGWLTFEDDKDYLKALWRDYQATDGETNFHRDRLRRLFFDVLSNPESQSRDYPDIGRVPFLNGGLFEETGPDEREGVVVPDAAIEPLLSELFDRFNFTVMESTPLDVEVAVDPEMLGKVFEELVTGRHESGSYYTPRPVVSFMCREALKGYLEGRDTGLDAEAIRAFVDEQRTEGVMGVAEARKLAAALGEVTVVDPACGSGAYLLGMMQELVELQRALFNAGATRKSLHQLKLEIIERNLYGVDNDQFAANIAMLRLWLSLAIEDEPPIEPLPHLEFKIACGDSLLGPDPSPENYGDLFRRRAHEVATNLAALKGRYMSTTIGTGELKQAIEQLEHELTEALANTAAPPQAVDWCVAFAEVFARGGFDIAIANPPYVRMEQLKSVSKTLASLYPAVHVSRADYLVYFYNRAIEVLTEGGTLAFVTSNSFMSRGYGKKLRGFLADQMTVRTMIDFGELSVFGATVETLVLVGRKGPPGSQDVVSGHNLYPLLSRRIGRGANVDRVGEELANLPEHLSSEVSTFPASRLTASEWRIEDEEVHRLLERLMNVGTALGEFAEDSIYMGVKTGLNEAFVIDEAQRNELVAADPQSAELMKPWLRGRDIKRWRTEWADKYIIFTSRGVNIGQYPAIEEHLEAFRPALEKRATAHLHPWYEHQQPQEGIYQKFSCPKVVWPDIAREMRFAYDIKGSYLDMTCFTMPTESRWLLATLNSELTEFLLCLLTSSLRGGFLRPKRQYMTRLPIVTPDGGLQRELEAMAEAGVAGEPVDTDALNALVYDLYGLSQSDRALIGDWFERRSLTTGEVP